MLEQALTKQQYAISLRLYINHKQVLEKYSPHYKQGIVAASMAKCYTVYKMVKDSCPSISMETLCSFVRMHEQDLRNILPNPNNATYQKQAEKLEKIITIAKTFKA
jgi:hypothetical protein